MVGFVYSIVGMKDRQVLQWSHMLGVLKDYANSGLGLRLKLAQRDKALAGGYDLVEWTFDPLQTLNAHLNFTKLGVVAEEYHRNVYGESTSVLHKGTPTDRLVAQWWIRQPHVERRVAPANGVPVRAADLADAAPINVTRPAERWLVQHRRVPDARRSPAAVRDPDGVHRDAARGAGAGARVADAVAARSSRPVLRGATAWSISSSTGRAAWPLSPGETGQSRTESRSRRSGLCLIQAARPAADRPGRAGADGTPSARPRRCS